ncbi:virulence RhuM family protein [Ruoffia tabacinasalis]|uniref:Virulence RhuM family protein n=1 Tax=Ruoffia tabacinasalis TaxID=87458 RepID=A0ABS0LGC8_9LACT|nr:virulence RhuM family protein [Ruoffia tabacinasalis]MBG9977266.1 virulence RhuM family protein [Ruoffia tabacinasalis]
MELEEQKFIMYETDDNSVVVDVIIMDETIWMTQKQMSKLFEVDDSVISKHLSNIFNENELEQNATVAKIATVRKEGNREVSRDLTYYNLDAIISVGYRVNSVRATHFRQWATSVLKEYMIKGFALDDDRLKQGSNLLDKDYFQELLERVRSIRASERRIWLKLTDIFAEVSTDYDKNSDITRLFYANMQNKFHFAIVGQTAAEIIYNSADQTKDNMGLTTWKNSPDGRILKSDTQVAKNYLSEKEIKQLERTVSSYFDYIEGLIERRNTFTMQDFSESINRFLEFNEYKILEGHGSVRMKSAKEKAGLEYIEFNKTQNIHSDFDEIIDKIIDEHK